MRVSDYSYEGYIRRAEQLFAKLNNIPEQSLKAWQAYRTHADPIKGKPQPHIEWNPRCNPRHGVEKNVPGYVVEIAAHTKICEAGGYPQLLFIAEDKRTQVELKIDFFYGDKTYQCKTVRFRGTQLALTPDLTEGIADYTVLMDIDDDLMYVVARTTLERLRTADLGYAAKGYVHKWDLDRESRHKFYKVFG